jgi:uncharacterized protein DUF5709
VDDDIEDNADTGVLDSEDTLQDGDPYDEGYSPPERPVAVNDWGGRLAREVPDTPYDESDGLGDSEDTDGELVDDEVGDLRAGRLVATNEGFGVDSDEELHASDVGIDGGAASAEEAAVHVVSPRDF